MPVVIAVVVAYQPEIATFLPLVEQLGRQAAEVLIVDNSAQTDNRVLEYLPQSLVESGRYSIIRLGGNFGIGTALNIGIDEALRRRAEFVLLSDQDSLPADDMLDSLCRAHEDLTTRGFKVAAIGPTFNDIHTAKTYPFQVQLPGKFFYGHKSPSEEEPHLEAFSVITSGSLIPAAAIQAVGPMREDLFIDNVDVEWCLRARSMGYGVFGTGWATMYQRLGQARIRVWYLRWRYESEYSPLRNYYRLRNLIALWKLSYIDWRWKVRNTWYGLGVVYTHTFFAREKNAQHFFMAAKGVWHGLTNRMGPYREG
jgi:rhamnosyltransferase